MAGTEPVWSPRVVGVSGANGFIGRQVAAAWTHRGARVLRIGRGPTDDLAFDLSDLAALAEGALHGIDLLIHCAGWAHNRGSTAAAIHQQLNCDAALALARAAARDGVRRFVFCSSVKAAEAPDHSCHDERSPGLPAGPYGRAKRDAEAGLLALAAATGLEVVNARLSMVWGPGGRGNLERMFALVRRGRFPPLPETGNRRSMVHVRDAAAALLALAQTPGCAGQTYVVTSRTAPSGRELYDAMCRACGRRPSGMAVPAAALRAAGALGSACARMTGREMLLDRTTVSRLLDSEWYSAARLEHDTGWRATVTLDDGLRELYSAVLRA